MKNLTTYNLQLLSVFSIIYVSCYFLEQVYYIATVHIRSLTENINLHMYTYVVTLAYKDKQ